MNRIIIVGNGFDISCGLKTSYRDFLFYYLKVAIQKANESNEYKYSDNVIAVVINLKTSYELTVLSMV